MPFDPQALVDQVVSIIKSAIAPVQADLTVVKAQLSGVESLRERVAVVETKADRPIPVPQIPTIPDIAPLLERMAAAEARMSVIGDVRDRVVAVEAKSMQPVLALPPEAGIDDLKDRIKTLEMRAEGPSLAEMGIVELRKGLSDVQAELRQEVRENISLRERIAVLEARPPVPGPAGEPGPAGRDGKDGEPGKPGLEFAGVYQEGKSYERGHMVTWGGGSWHCNEPTNDKPGEGSKAWTLMVKRGRDGKDGRDAVTVPVVSLK